MKKIISTILVIFMIFTISGCSNKNDEYMENKVTVALSSDNFNEYFEMHEPFLELDKYGDPNLFKENEAYTYRWVLKSKKFDEGLVLLRDESELSKITCEVISKASDGYEHEFDISLGDMLLNGSTWLIDSEDNVEDYDICLSGRIIGGSITFIKKDYIESYDINVKDDSYGPFDATIKLKNGMEYHNYVYPDFPY